MSNIKLLLLYEKDHFKHLFIEQIISNLSQKIEKEDFLVASFSPLPGEKEYKYTSVSMKYEAGMHWGMNNFIFKLRSKGALIFNFMVFINEWILLRRYKPTIVITFLPASFLAARSWAIFSHARIVYYPFEIYGEQHSKPSIFLQLAERIGFLLSPDAFVTQNEHRKDFYLRKRFCRAKTHIVHNYKEHPIEGNTVSNLYTAYGIPLDAKIILYQGMLTEGRWLDRLILSAKYFSPDTVLVLMGRKHEAWWNKNIVPIFSDPDIVSRVFVLDSVPHKKVGEYVQGADAGVIIYDDSVLNNRYCEPGKLGDFVHFGIPVIAPDFPTIGSLIQDNDLGVVFDIYTPQGIANSINKLFSYPADHFKQSLEKATKYMLWETQWPVLDKAIFGDK